MAGLKISKNKNFFIGLSIFSLSFFLFAHPAFAMNTIFTNINLSVRDFPGLVTVFAYILGIVLVVWGIIQLKQHVDNPQKIELRWPVMKFLAGGSMFALPALFVAAKQSIDNIGVPGAFLFDFSGLVSGALGTLTAVTGVPSVNGILENIVGSVSDAPGLVAVFSYLLALVFIVAGVLKIKDAVENPTQTSIREGVIRILIGGALLALDDVMRAATGLISGGDANIMTTVNSIFSVIGWSRSAYGAGVLNLCDPTSITIGGRLCVFVISSSAAPAFLSALSYIFACVLTAWGLLKVKDHVVDPTRTTVWEGASRLLAAGAFFALPVTVSAIKSTITTVGIGTALNLRAISRYNETASVCDGLDGALYCMMSDVLTPIHVVLNFFTFVAGVILIMIGISRLMKGAQEGAKAPGGLGTFMTFIIGGALLSYNELIRAFTGSFFSNPLTLTYANLQYNTGMAPDELAHAHTVISAILKFMIVIGLISFVRGLFIIRNVAEGSGQASLMAGVTHMVGGALAVNMGPLMNAVQNTLGIANYGVTFGV